MKIKRLCAILLISVAVLICLGIYYKIGCPSEEVGKNGAFKMADNWEEQFYISEIDDELFHKMQGASFKEDCTVSRESLRYVHILHCDFNNDTSEGELVCNQAIAQDLLEIFMELYKSGYQIEKVRLVDEYGAVDEDSMADNNSSAFNYRTISYSDIISAHGMGVAVDINPLYNPYVKEVNGRTSVEPANGEAYVDRTQDFSHKIDHDDLCYKLFVQYGFQWGGDWTDSKDYQHFEKTID
ncbi:MAG: M15 family metallopeptidase [Lachnospiraceae bacterium]|nr:M15 family metallopeptidase [Lachnospiraceae bacterium]